MKKNIVRKVSKLSVFLVVFLMLTLVFTLYQTSVNTFVADVATDLNLDETEPYKLLNFEEMNSITAQAASVSNFSGVYRAATTTADAKWWAADNQSSVDVTISTGTALYRSIRGGVVQHAARLDIEDARGGDPEKASVDTKPTGAHTGDASGNSTGQTYDTGWKTTPKDATTYVCWVYCHAGGNASGHDGRAHCTLLLKTTDTTGPTISTTNASTISGASWQTSNSVTVSDNGAGLGSITVTYTNLSGTTNTSTGLDWTISGSERKTSRTLTLGNGEGKYVITAKDDVGNSSTKTVWYYNSTITATVASSAYGNAYVSTSSTSSGSSSTLTGRYGGQSYYIYAKPNAGYYFTGWTGEATLGVGTYVDGKWMQSRSIPASPTKNSFSYTAQFSAIAPLLKNNGVANSSGATSFEFDYNGKNIPLTLSVPSGYGGTLTFSGTTDGKSTYSTSATAPTYAGTYTAYVNLTYNSNPIGSASFEVKIKPINVYAKPTFASITMNGNTYENGKIYDGTNTITQSALTNWVLGSESAGKTPYTNDGLTFTSKSNSFTYNDKNVGLGNKTIAIQTDATIGSTKSNASDIAASYVFNRSGDTINGTILPKQLTVVSAGYGSGVEGTTVTGYVSGSLITGTHYGKVYDSSTSAKIRGLVFSGYVPGDSIGFALSTQSSTGYEVTTENAGTIIQDITANFDDKHVGTGKSVTSVSLILFGDDNTNYYLKYNDGSYIGNAITAYTKGTTFQLIQEGCTIVQKDATVVITGHTNKIYDGSTNITVTLGWKDDVSPIQGSDNLYINGATGFTAKLNDATANYYNGDNAPTGGRVLNENHKTIVAEGVSLALGDPNDASVAGNTRLTNYRLTSTTTATYESKDYSLGSDGKLSNEKDFIAVKTKLLTPTLIATNKDDASHDGSKIYDGNNLCYNYYFTNDALSGDVVIINTTNVNYGGINVGEYVVTASGLSISGDDAINYHLNVASITDATKRKITQKDISCVNIDEIPDVYYRASIYTPTPKVYDPTLKDDSGATITTPRELASGTDFQYAYMNEAGDTPTASQNTGTYTLRVNGEGNYSGYATIKYNIKQASVQIGDMVTISKIYGQNVVVGDIKAESITLGSQTVQNILNLEIANLNDVSALEGCYSGNEITKENIYVVGAWSFVGTLPKNVKDGGHTVKVQFTPQDKVNYATPGEKELTLIFTKRDIKITATETSVIFGNEITTNFKTNYTVETANTDGTRGLAYSTDSFGELYSKVENFVYALPGTTLEEGKEICMAGTYPILSNLENSNYNIDYTGANYIINPRAITLTIQTGQKKVYGDADPASFVYEVSKNSSGTVNVGLVEGSLVRDGGENYGNYGIKFDNILNSNFNKTNYVITTETAVFTIEQKTIKITPNNVIGHFYGEEIVIDQTAYTVEGLAERDNGKSYAELFTTLSIIRREGSNTTATTKIDVGTYGLYIDRFISANNNYVLEKGNGSFIIIPRPILITPDAGQGKVYDGHDTNAVLTYTASNNAVGLNGDAVKKESALNGTLSRVSGADAGEYPILQGSLSNEGGKNPNYQISFDPNLVNYVISQLSVTITVHPSSISVGDPAPEDSALTFDASSSIALPTPINGWVMIERDEIGNLPTDVGTYNVVADSTMLNNNPNYSINVLGEGKFVIKMKTANITPEAKSIVFGTKLTSANINLSYTIVDDDKGHDLSHLENVEYTGELSISLGDLLLKNAGESDADYKVRVDEWLENNYLPAGDYEIVLGSMQSILHGDDPENLVKNYDVKITKGVKLTVTQKPITITVDASEGNLTKVYDGTKEAGIKYLVSEDTPLVEGFDIDPQSALAREPGVEVAEYAINIGNFNAEGLNPNYTFTLAENTDSINKKFYYVITKRFITVIPVVPNNAEAYVDENGNGEYDEGEAFTDSNGSGEWDGNKIFSVYGAGDTVIGYRTVLTSDPTKPGLINEGQPNGDKLRGNLSREQGSDVRAEGYAIQIGSLNSEGTNLNHNYSVILDDQGVRYYVTRRPVTATADSIIGRNAPTFGDAERNLTVKYQNLVGASKLEGTIVREEGITPKPAGQYYRIMQGSMTNENNPNFNITFVEGQYEIKQKAVTVNAVKQSKGYLTGDPDEFKYTITGAIEGYDVGLTTSRLPGEMPGSYGIVLILDNDSDCINNSYYTFAQFKANANYGGKRVFVDNNNAFTINQGTAVIGFRDGTTLRYAEPYEDLNGNGWRDDNEPFTDVNGNQLHDVSYELILEYNGFDQTVDAYLILGGDEEYTDENGNGEYDEGESFVDVNLNGAWDSGVSVTYRVNRRPGRTFKNAGDYTLEITAAAKTGLFKGTTATVYVTITPKNLGTVNPTDYLSADVLTKVYGEDDKGDYTFMMPALGEDVITATMVREEGEDVGSYSLLNITIDNPNYALVFEEGSNEDIFSITQKEIEVSPDLVQVPYGTIQTTWEQYLTTDRFENDIIITFTRTESDNHNAKTYDVESYSLNSTNYYVTFTSEDAFDGKFIITPVVAVVKAVSDKKVFDGIAIDLASLSYEVTGMVNDEVPVGTLTIVADGELDLINVGKYSIVAEGFDSASNPNYVMSFVGATYDVTPAPITIIPRAISYVYGETIAPFEYDLQVGSKVFAGYPLEGELGTLSNVNAGDHPIPQGTLDNAEGRNKNYKIEYQDFEIFCSIAKRYVKIKVDGATQTYGEPMPELNYEFVDGTSMVGEDKLVGTLSATGHDVGEYEIIMSDEFLSMNPNYDVELDSSEAIYTITARPLTITADYKEVVYGEERVELTYTTDNLVEGDTLSGALLCLMGTDAGAYTITRGSLDNANYDITFVPNDYVIIPRELTVTIHDAESEYGQEEAIPTYSITKGNLIDGDELGVTLSRESGTAMGFYKIYGTHSNTNYVVNFIEGTYTIKKFKAVINVVNQYINFVEDGNFRSIDASCTSGAAISFSIDFEEVRNAFKNAGKYVVVLNSIETETHYAPDPVTVYITINRPFIQSEANGIDIKLESENGFDPNMTVDMSKLPADFPEIQAELKSNQKIVRAFTLTTSGDQSTESVPGKTTVTIKVPSSLQEETVVKVMVQEDGVYNMVELDVVDGYVTLEADSLSSFAFIAEETNNYFLLIIIGAAVLIVLGSVMVFLFRKRA